MGWGRGRYLFGGGMLCQSLHGWRTVPMSPRNKSVPLCRNCNAAVRTTVAVVLAACLLLQDTAESLASSKHPHFGAPAAICGGGSMPAAGSTPPRCLCPPPTTCSGGLCSTGLDRANVSGSRVTGWKRGRCPHCRCARSRGVNGINRTAVGSCARLSYPRAAHARDPPFPHRRNDDSAGAMANGSLLPKKRLIHIDPQFGKVIGMMLEECFGFETCPAGHPASHKSRSPPCEDADLICKDPDTCPGRSLPPSLNHHL